MRSLPRLLRAASLAMLFLACAPTLDPDAVSADVASFGAEREHAACAPRRRAHRRPSRRRGRGRRAPARRPRPYVSPAYRRMKQRWHAPPPAALRARWLRTPTPPLVLRPVGRSHEFALEPETGGRFGEEALASARDAFRYRVDGATHDIHPRLLELCYRAVRHFRAPYVTLVSGYRTTRSTSRHNQGRAMDIVLPGIHDERLADFLRKQGFVGVGVYPNSGFVHLDVRARSYYWIDRSGPDQEPMVEPTLARLVSRNDAAARRRGERPVADLVASASETEEGAIAATRGLEEGEGEGAAEPAAEGAEGAEAEPTEPPAVPTEAADGGSP